MFWFAIFFALTASLVSGQGSSNCRRTVPTAVPHCSEICIPFKLDKLSAPITRDICFGMNVYGSPNHNKYVYVELHNTCERTILFEAAIQAIDQHGYPVGRWEVGYRKNILQDHCELGDRGRPFLYLDSDEMDTPIIQEVNCTRTPSLTGRLNTYRIEPNPTFVHIDHTKVRTQKYFTSTVMLWRYEGARGIKVVFFAEVFAKIRDQSMYVHKVKVDGNSFLVYIPSPQPNPVPLQECFPIPEEFRFPTSTFSQRTREQGENVPVPNVKYFREVAELLKPTTTMTTTTTTTSTKRTVPPLGPRTTIGRGIRPLLPGNTPPPLVTSDSKRNKEEEERNQNVIKQEKDIYERCELTKKCLTSQINLKKDGTARPKPGRRGLDPCIIGKECDVMISYGSADIDFEVPDDHIYIEFVGRSNYWVAIGLSGNQRMGKDFVFECVREGSEDIQMYTSWNVIQGVNKRLNRSDPRYANIVTVYQTGFSEGNTFCKFSAKKVISVFPDEKLSISATYTLNLERTLYYILMAVGQSGDGIIGENGNLNDHHDDYRYTSGYPVAIGTRFSPTKSQQILIYLHGQFMYVAFLFCFPISTFLGRYYKETYIKKISGVPKWLFWHVILHLVGFLLVILGHFCLTFANERWTRLGSNETSFHLWTSLIAGAFYFFNMLMGLLNHGRGTSGTSEGWQIIHALIGHVAYLVSLACISRSDRVLYSYLPCGISTIISIWVWIYFLFNIAMSYHYCWIDYVRGEELGVGLYALGLRELLVQPSKDVVAPGKKIRVYIFYAYCGTAAIITLACILVAVFSGKKNACRTEDYFIDLV